MVQGESTYLTPKCDCQNCQARHQSRYFEVDAVYMKLVELLETTYPNMFFCASSVQRSKYSLNSSGFSRNASEGVHQTISGARGGVGAIDMVCIAQ